MQTGGARNLWSEQTLVLPVEDVITGLEFLVDLPMQSLMGQQDKTKKNYVCHLGAAPHQLGNIHSHAITEVKQR